MDICEQAAAGLDKLRQGKVLVCPRLCQLETTAGKWSLPAMARPVTHHPFSAFHDFLSTSDYLVIHNCVFVCFVGLIQTRGV